MVLKFNLSSCEIKDIIAHIEEMREQLNILNNMLEEQLEKNYDDYIEYEKKHETQKFEPVIETDID